MNLLKKISYSSTWKTTLSVTFIVLISVAFTSVFFWRSLYLPELRNHARYLASELTVLDAIHQNGYGSTDENQRLRNKMHTIYIDDPKQFPKVEEKIFAGFFTQILQQEVEKQLNRPVTVFFKFKPSSQLWIQDSKYNSYWLREPVIYYSHYNPILLIGFLFGIPLLSVFTIILLARQLNRPLKDLQKATSYYTNFGSAELLPTDKGPIEIRQVNMAFNQLFMTLNQAKKERNIMLAGISHDLRTPLTRMRLSAEMLEDDFLKEGIIYDVNDMDNILEQFISFMKDGSDEPIQMTSLSEMIREIIVQFAPLDIHHIDNGLPELPLRSLSIKRLLTNLVSNANRYGQPPIIVNTEIVDKAFTPQENKNIISAVIDNSLSTDLEIADESIKEQVVKESKLAKTANQELVISVYDHGQGVENEALERIMQPFERGESARTTQGSGLGLAIVARIARLHHGHVTVKNHLEGGLQITVRIPIILEET